LGQPQGHDGAAEDATQRRGRLDGDGDVGDSTSASQLSVCGPGGSEVERGDARWRYSPQASTHGCSKGQDFGNSELTSTVGLDRRATPRSGPIPARC
jgi:hypothetical protein